ncbi:MAG TPA: hypothetical protein VNQ73_18930 [Ilumatobacter sp.]|nr:hypothetical protein [Ilumatobacter sp.]
MEHVRFDIEGALPLARQLWQFADRLNDVRNRRDDLARLALRDWQGRHGTTFRDWNDQEHEQLKLVIVKLRQAALAWARAWATAVNKQRDLDHDAAWKQWVADTARDALANPLPLPGGALVTGVVAVATRPRPQRTPHVDTPSIPHFRDTR